MLEKHANNFQYLFLGGIIGEVLALPFVGNYLKENKKILNELKIDHVHCHTLNSLKAACSNLDELNKLIHFLFEKNQKKIVIFAHSKGCLEVVLDLIENHDKYEVMVEKIICVQPPFKGSSLFDKYQGHWMAPITNLLIKKPTYIWPGLKSLQKGRYDKRIENGLSFNNEIKDYIHSNLLVVRGFKADSKDVAWIIRPTHEMMASQGHKSDGLVKLEDQTLPNSQYLQITLDIDHSDLFTSSLLSQRDTDFRKTVLTSLCNWAITSNQEYLHIDIEELKIIPEYVIC